MAVPLTVMFDERRTLDEENAWGMTFGDENWDEFDEALYSDALYTDNFRDRESRGEYGEDALIYNELILEPHIPVHVERERRAHFLTKTKKELIVRAGYFNVRLNMRMTKTQMVDTIMRLVPIEN